MEHTYIKIKKSLINQQLACEKPCSMGAEQAGTAGTDLLHHRLHHPLGNYH
jgi:hypothetical protein